ncbi:MAG TPA: hypothetical protein VGB30_01770 [bacterium]
MNVKITHPFPDNPEFTGFDVKGIIMFNGSWETDWKSKHFFPYDEVARVSYREYGDPELINADGYSPRWCPEWPSGSEMPIFNYWEGKYSNGTPTANINGFLNFYTDEERHMFRVGQTVTRTYHIALPPGPVIAGYAVDACWEPPLVTPVSDPLTDFPYSANQPEPYYFRLVLNNDQVIEDLDCCGSALNNDCSEIWVEWRTWYDQPNADTPEAPRGLIFRRGENDPSFGSGILLNGILPDCTEGTGPDSLALKPGLIQPGYQGEGKWRYATLLYFRPSGLVIGAYDIVDVEVDFP